MGYVSTGHYWRDIGTTESYLRANREALGENPFLTGPECRIHSTVRLEEWGIMGQETRLEKGVVIRGSILWEKVTVRAGKKVVNSIVTSSKVVDHDLVDQVL